MELEPPSKRAPDAFVCEHCGSTYSRLDHLTRHIRSHTKERPFPCEHCGKAFARTDLLRRHVLGHQTSLSSNKRQKLFHEPTRSRIAQACIACAKSKLRCDGAEPCSRCSKKDTECIYKSSSDVNKSVSAPIEANGTVSGDSENAPSEAQLNVVTSQMEEPNPDLNTNMITEEAPWDYLPQLPTPGTFDEIQADNQPSVEASGSNVDFDDSYLAEFLKDIMYPTDPLTHPLADSHDINFAPKDFLDFNMPTSFEYLNGYDIPQIPARNDDVSGTDGAYASHARSGYATPTGNKNGLLTSAQAFKESLWLWTPQQGERTQAEHANLSIPVEAFISMEREGLGRPPFQPLGQTARDRILAAVLGTCESSMTSGVVSSFPSAELLTVLIHKWMIYHRSQIDTWYHFGNFDPNNEPPEILLGMIAAGASLSKNPRLRKLGYAFQEAARAVQSSGFEGDNRNIRKLRPIQALALLLDVGLWSGDRRKVEIAESFSQCLVTMFRRGGKFVGSDDTALPNADDDPDEVERKWRLWIEAESYRRMAAHLLIRDSQTSSSLLIPPLVSFSESTCSLPALRSVWMASNATQWFELIRSCAGNNQARLPSVRSCLHDISLISASRQDLDHELAVLTVSNAFWGSCWQHRQVEAITKHTWDVLRQTNGLIANSAKQMTVQVLQQFRLLASEVHEARPEATMTSERVLMNLHVSLEDVQLLAGKAGENEARRTFSTLKHWARSSDCRQAQWHAGQILRAARGFAHRTLRDASAIAVYHAGLVFWASAILTSTDNDASETAAAPEIEIVLNGDNTTHLERFVMLGRGRPTIKWHEGLPRGRQQPNAPARDARRVMKVIVDLLHTNNGLGDECPPLVDNLAKLMRSLGNAARSIRAADHS